MKDKRERWMELAKLAADEQDYEKMLVLVREINELLEGKEKRLAEEEKTKQTATQR
jgi:hypothetical protein